MAPWSKAQCVPGRLAISGASELSALSVVRNTGGGSSSCCWHHPISAAARIVGDGIELALEPLVQPKQPSGGARSAPQSRNGARVYLAHGCVEGSYNGTQPLYTRLQLVGKVLSFTADVSRATCGCNVAAYLVAMGSNRAPGVCDGDFYCDAMSVCGTPCAEVDLMEANAHAFHATAHTSGDGKGGGQQGVGGRAGLLTHSGWAFSAEEYGPGGTVIDTSLPFRVSAHFEADAAGRLESIEMVLRQPPLEAEDGQAGRVLRFPMASADYVAKMRDEFARGLTLTLSYWSATAKELSWLQGGVCGAAGEDQQLHCADSVRFSGFELRPASPLPDPPRPPAPPPPSPPSPPSPLGRAAGSGAARLDASLPHASPQTELALSSPTGLSTPEAATCVGLGAGLALISLLCSRAARRRPGRTSWTRVNR